MNNYYDRYGGYGDYDSQPRAHYYTSGNYGYSQNQYSKYSPDYSQYASPRDYTYGGRGNSGYNSAYRRAHDDYMQQYGQQGEDTMYDGENSRQEYSTHDDSGSSSKHIPTWAGGLDDSSSSGSGSTSGGPSAGCCFKVGLGASGYCCLVVEENVDEETCRNEPKLMGSSIGWAPECPSTPEEAGGLINAESTPTDSDNSDAPPEPFVLNFVENIYPIFQNLRANVGHGQTGGARGLLDMSTAKLAYDNTVNVPSKQQAEGMPLINPCRSSESYLWHKIAGSQVEVGGQGNQMPPSEPRASQEQLEVVAKWINEGAKYDADSAPFQCNGQNQAPNPDSTHEGPSSSNQAHCPPSMEAWDHSDRRCNAQGAVCTYDEFCCCPNETEPSMRGPCVFINNLRCNRGIWELFYGEQPSCAWDTNFKCPSQA